MQFNRIKGMIYGVCVSDAAGIYYEFKERSIIIEPKDIIFGGGNFNLAKGQISDDSEMMLSLLSYVCENQTYDQKLVYKKYKKWYNSSPPDIGITIKNALTTKIASDTSLSNGVLMRISPIVLYGLTFDDKTFKNIIQQECEITHKSQTVIDYAIIYCYILKYIIQGYSLEYIKNFLIKLDIKLINNSFLRPEPVELNNIELLNDDPKFMGYIGIALQNTIYELFNGSSFDTSITNIISRGGDTDTNGSIAGAILGAYYGYSNINKEWLFIIKSAVYERNKLYPEYNIKIIDNLLQKFKKK